MRKKQLVKRMSTRGYNILKANHKTIKIVDAKKLKAGYEITFEYNVFHEDEYEKSFILDMIKYSEKNAKEVIKYYNVIELERSINNDKLKNKLTLLAFELKDCYDDCYDQFVNYIRNDICLYLRCYNRLVKSIIDFNDINTDNNTIQYGYTMVFEEGKKELERLRQSLLNRSMIKK